MSRFNIVTERLLLRPLGVGDLDTVNEYALDRENARYMIHLPNENARETLAFLQQAEAERAKIQPDSYEFAVLYQGRHIGAVNIRVDGNTGELGWILNKAYWGNGFAAEAAQALVDHFAKRRHITHFVAHCDGANAASFRIMEKLGMERTTAYGGRRNRAANTDSTEFQYELWL